MAIETVEVDHKAFDRLDRRRVLDRQIELHTQYFDLLGQGVNSPAR